MFSKKIIIASFSLLFFTFLLLSQDLAELAKKEKERRANLKNKKGIVVTNVDLKKTEKRIAILVSALETSKEQKTPEVKRAQEPLLPEEPSQKPLAEREKYFKERKAALEKRWKQAKEYADLLATKMGGLWQEYYSMDDMTSRDKVQIDISGTFLQMQKARQEETKAKEELDKFLIQARKEGALPGWLR